MLVGKALVCLQGKPRLRKEFGEIAQVVIDLIVDHLLHPHGGHFHPIWSDVPGTLLVLGAIVSHLDCVKKLVSHRYLKPLKLRVTRAVAEVVVVKRDMGGKRCRPRLSHVDLTLGITQIPDGPGLQIQQIDVVLPVSAIPRGIGILHIAGRWKISKRTDLPVPGILQNLTGGIHPIGMTVVVVVPLRLIHCAVALRYIVNLEMPFGRVIGALGIAVSRPFHVWLQQPPGGLGKPAPIGSNLQEDGRGADGTTDFPCGLAEENASYPFNQLLLVSLAHSLRLCRGHLKNY